MNKRNYQKELDQVLDQLCTDKEETAPTLLLHSCCAPCSSYVLEYLSRYFRITVLYYNPNIYPESEYHNRVQEQMRLIRELPTRYPVDFLEGDYIPADFYHCAKGMEEIPEGGKRCFACYRLRLTEAVRTAKEKGCDFVATTLSISPLIPLTSPASSLRQIPIRSRKGLPFPVFSLQDKKMSPQSFSIASLSEQVVSITKSSPATRQEISPSLAFFFNPSAMRLSTSSPYS